jgi:hypothetical protein
MPFAALLIGALLIIVAFNNSFGALATELETDVPGYFKWAAAIAAILALGYIPGFRTPSRYLLGLVLLVLLLTNYQQIYAGLSSFASSPGSASGTGAAQPAPSTSYVAANAPAASATSSGSNTTSAGVAASVTPQGLASAASTVAANPLSPSAYLAAFGSSGFGGIV